jgi:hypothetical protein
VIAAGHSGLLAIANEKTDHLWIVLTDQAADPLAVLVMLTDIRNMDVPDLALDAGEHLTPHFILTKRSTIDFARARKLDWRVLQKLFTKPHFISKGVVPDDILATIRSSLLTSPNTPVDVLEYCRGRSW